jgi:surface antigen
MRSSKFVAIILATGMLAACQQPGQYPGTGAMQGGAINKQDVGTLAGAIGGGIIGSNIGGGKGAIAGTIAGTLLGGVVGSSIGRSLDNADRMAAEQASQRALETAQPGQSLPWKNTQSGNYGSITPSNYYQNAAGDYCREYTQTIVVGGRSERGHGTACRQPDGSWQIVQ